MTLDDMKKSLAALPREVRDTLALPEVVRVLRKAAADYRADGDFAWSHGAKELSTMAHNRASRASSIADWLEGK